MPIVISRSAVWTYGLAFLGAHLAFMPLLVLLLPRRVEALAAAGAPASAAVMLSWLLLTGGIVAGQAHIAAGAAGDRWLARFGNRRGLIAIGTFLLALSYVGLAFADSFASLFTALIAFQIALNCCFSPLGALLADHVPNDVKGRLSGLANAALPASTFFVAAIAWAFPQDNIWAFLAIGLLAAGCIAPLLVRWPFAELVEQDGDTPDRSLPAKRHLLSDFAIAWSARLLIQIGAAFLLSYIYLYIAATQHSNPAWGDTNASEILATLTAPAALLAIAATLVSGHLSDMRAKRRLPLFLAALIFASGIGTLAMTPQPALFIMAYGLFQIGLAAFLSIDTALVAQLVSGHPRRGAMLGVMNLSNTLPAVIAPALMLLAFGEAEIASALATVFGILATGAVIAGAMMLTIRNVR